MFNDYKLNVQLPDKTYFLSQLDRNPPNKGFNNL